MDAPTRLRYDYQIGQIVNKTIRGVVLTRGASPCSQLFLVFDDCHYEFYSSFDDITPTTWLCRNGPLPSPLAIPAGRILLSQAYSLNPEICALPGSAEVQMPAPPSPADQTKAKSSTPASPIGRNFLFRLGRILLLILCMVPPWRYTYSSAGMAEVHEPGPHALLLWPPEPTCDYRGCGVEIDFARLALELIIVAAITIAPTAFRTLGQSKLQRPDA